MRVPARLGLAVAAAGIGLGTMLGAAANPVMKMPAEQPWQGALRAPVTADPGYRIMIEAPPEDLSPYHDSYAPTWAHEELADWEPDYPAWTYSELVDERLEAVSVADTPRLEEVPLAPADALAPAAPPAAVEPLAPAPEPAIGGALAALY